MDKKILLRKLIKSWQDSPFPSTKMSSYFPAYVETFGHLVDSNAVFVEIGVLDGGSLFMWRSFFGPNVKIIGIDLNPAAIKWRDHGFDIHIGDQGDPEFWQQILPEIGPFDALLDDGGHQFFQQIVTVVECLKYATNDCVIAIEDSNTSFMKDFILSNGDYTFWEYAKSATDFLVARAFQPYGDRCPTINNNDFIQLFRNCYSTQFYAGIVVFHLNARFSTKPEILRNMLPRNTGDFRYEGRNSANVNWPNLNIEKDVEILGKSYAA